MSRAMTVTVDPERRRAIISAVWISQPARFSSPVIGSVHAAVSSARITSPKDSAAPTIATAMMR